jgi:hypothetical protein
VTVVGPSNSPPKIIKLPEDLRFPYNYGTIDIDVAHYFEDPEGGSLKIFAVYTIKDNID